jgi:hypothetical protein
MDGESRRTSLDWGMRDYATDLQPHIVKILQASFGAKWGDGAYWRWKHSSRPGFSPADVVVCTAADKPVACFHLAVRSMHLAPGLDICCSVEGDFAIEPDARGSGIPQKAYRYVSPRLVSRSVLVRAGFSSRELYEHVYKPKFGHGMLPTVTAQYRKILSDGALHGKLAAFGAELRTRPGLQRLLESRSLTIRMEIVGFKPCDLVLTPDAARCTASGAGRPDLRIKMPYILLTAARMRRSRAALTILRVMLLGRVRTSGLTRLLLRYLALIIHRR